MFKKLSDFDKKYSTLFFCISLLVIIVFLAYFSVLNNDKTKECKVPNNLVNNYTNYSYNITYENENKVIKLYVKRYDKKYLIEKIENDVKNSYYLYYTDILEKASNGEYIRFRKDNIVDGLDNKFLLLEYINDISLQSNVTTNDGLTCYINRKLSLNMCVNLDNSITLKANDYNLIYNVEQVGTIKDFTVDVNLNYVESDTDELIDNSNVE